MPSSGCTENYILTSCFLYKLRCSRASPQNRQCAMHNIVVHYLCGCVEFYFLLFKIVVIKFFSIVQYIYCEARAKVNKRVFMLTHSMLFQKSIGLALSHILRCIQTVRVNLLRLKKKKKHKKLKTKYMYILKKKKNKVSLMGKQQLHASFLCYCSKPRH